MLDVHQYIVKKVFYIIAKDVKTRNSVYKELQRN